MIIIDNLISKDWIDRIDSFFIWLGTKRIWIPDTFRRHRPAHPSTPTYQTTNSSSNNINNINNINSNISTEVSWHQHLRTPPRTPEWERWTSTKPTSGWSATTGSSPRTSRRRSAPCGSSSANRRSASGTKRNATTIISRQDWMTSPRRRSMAPWRYFPPSLLLLLLHLLLLDHLYVIGIQFYVGVFGV